jgi:hypothetical protein
VVIQYDHKFPWISPTKDQIYEAKEKFGIDLTDPLVIKELENIENEQRKPKHGLQSPPKTHSKRVEKIYETTLETSGEYK